MGQIVSYILAYTSLIIFTPVLVCYALIFGGRWDSYFKTEHDYRYCPNGAELIFETPDSGLTCKDLQMDSTRMYRITSYSILHGRDTITIWETQYSTFQYDTWRPLFVHRHNGRIDTLCFPGRDKTWVGHTSGREKTRVGYIQREYKDDKWLVVEAKQPDKILGKTHLVDKRSMSYRAHSMSDYDFEGQYIVFNSEISDYWIASRRSPDLYGPMNIKELKRVGASLGIEFPITLKGNLDQYACPCNIKGEDVSDQYSIPNEPKSIIDWYHWYFTGRPDRVIE